MILSTTKQVDANTTAECDAARALLTQAGVKFIELWYNDPNVDERKPALESLSTWTWKGSRQRQFTRFPILHWTEHYDDWSTEVDHAAGVAEIQASSLLSNKALVE